MSLDLSQNSLTDEAVPYLAKLLQHNKTLQKLKLCGTSSLSDKSINSLSSSLSQNQSLRYLDLGPVTEV